MLLIQRHQTVGITVLAVSAAIAALLGLVFVAFARTPQEKDMLQRQVESTDEAIDRLVYQLYGLTEEEIKIVERE